MNIAEVAKKYGVTPDTIRYYEKAGLIPAAPRRASGIRNFDEKTCNWLEFIVCMRSAGLTIEALTEYVRLYKKGKSTVSERKNLLVNQREELRRKKEEIEATLNRLDYKISLYEQIEAGKRKDFMEEP
ncbi:MAG TPA: MerR family transcriptional regulator [Clostridiales bacterium]|nr:MerR family transcriptional regulator [Clostridiales bacterium]